MAVCVDVVGDYLAVNTVPVGSCTTYILQSSSDYAATVPAVSVDDAILTSWAIVGVWALAWAVKLLRRAL